MDKMSQLEYLTILVSLALFLGTPTSGTTPGNSSVAGHLADFRQDWGYVEIRDQAHMFYWLFYTTHARGVTESPLVIWLQGGPGYSSTGHGNLEEIGPADLNGNVRNYSWVQEASLLFVDSPVGVGYSYVDTDDVRPKTDDAMVQDLVTFFTHFLEKYPGFKTTPLYVVGQSYGGKMAAMFTWALHQAIKAGTLEVPLKGVAMGNAWVSPVDSVVSWAEFLFSVSVLDKHGWNEVRQAAATCRQDVDSRRWEQAADCMFETQSKVRRINTYIDFYNVLKHPPQWVRSMRKKRAHAQDDDFPGELLLPAAPPINHINAVMNGPIREYLGIIPDDVKFHRQSPAYEFMKIDFMKPATMFVERLLNQTDLRVVVYQGQMDVICASPGAYAWVDALKWAHAQEWRDSMPYTIWSQDESALLMYLKSARRFHYYNILQAGHEVPIDQPEAALLMLRAFLNGTDDVTPVSHAGNQIGATSAQTASAGFAMVGVTLVAICLSLQGLF